MGAELNPNCSNELSLCFEVVVYRRALVRGEGVGVKWRVETRMGVCVPAHMYACTRTPSSLHTCSNACLHTSAPVRLHTCTRPRHACMSALLHHCTLVGMQAWCTHLHARKPTPLHDCTPACLYTFTPARINLCLIVRLHATDNCFS